MQHPHAIAGGMDNNTTTSASNTGETHSTGGDSSPSRPLTDSELTARYRLIYDDLCRYCSDMWGNISSVRSRSVEHVVFSASLSGLHLAFDATSDSYRLGWWGLAGFLALLATALPHLRIVIGFSKINESRLNMGHSASPLGGPEKLIIASLEEKADSLEIKSEIIGEQYVLARMCWLIGITASAALVLLEWFL